VSGSSQLETIADMSIPKRLPAAFQAGLWKIELRLIHRNHGHFLNRYQPLMVKSTMTESIVTVNRRQGLARHVGCRRPGVATSSMAVLWHDLQFL